MNQLRIIAGKWRGKKIQFIDQEDLRPTPDRVRETLFNWLQQDIVNAHCLDLFAGSGILGIEALSRGAKFVTSVEMSREALICIRENLESLIEIPLRTIQANALDYLQNNSPEYPMEVVFLDPPFSDNQLLQDACQYLEKNNWLAGDAKIYLESGTNLEELNLPDSWSLIKSKKAGQVYYGLCQRNK
ncbi:MAG: 16S rRNA (guanine(966)-N(2))-methyltransferase RsmD [Gammaproteobacteria bacterium]|nr:16S rRNA (guanine(966)-N(2))-methyltransferase RsmD [Gammaproteobacteria bacterium]MAY01839.1 16S rRNA (guanine(966)-N(2))-methyltransferase RsmD [Gammaproteobacteria bacterium]